MKRIDVLVLFMIVLLSAGCNGQLAENGGRLREDLTFKVESAVPAEGVAGSRSSYRPDSRDKITDYTIFVFDSRGNNVSANYFKGDENMSGRALFVNGSLKTTFSDSFDVYIIANLGDLRSDGAVCAGGVPAADKIKAYSYGFSRNFPEFSSKGFPMAGFYDDYCPESDPRTLYADKLVTQYNIRFTKSAGNPNTYTVTAGKLCNVASKCTPFKQFKAASSAEVMSAGDWFSSSDIAALNAGGSSSLFVLENEQGDVFPTSVKKENQRKMESFPSGSKYREICTYAEFYVTVKTPTATYDNVIYRYFFGNGIRDCSVPRNMIYTLTMNFDNVLVENEGWRIEPGDPQVDNGAIALSRERLSIIKGMSNSFTVTRKPNVEYEMSYSQADAKKYGLTITKTVSGNVDKYTLTTSYTPSTTASSLPLVDYADIPVTFTTADGLLAKTFTVRINKNPLLVEFSFYDGAGHAKISNTVDWPSGATFETSVTGILYGENQYCTNRILGNYRCDIWQHFLGVSTASNRLDGGDAATADFQTAVLSTGEMQMAMHDLNSSHPVDHHYAVGATETHYTTIGHAYLKIYYAVKINGGVAQVPVTIITTRGSSRPGDAFTVDADGSGTYLSVTAQKAPAWFYEPKVTINAVADGYTGGYTTPGHNYPVSLQKITVSGSTVTGYQKGDLNALYVEGAARDSYNPMVGIDCIYGIPDFVSY